MKPSKSYQGSLIKSLKDPTAAAEYINAAIEENDLDTLLLAFRNVAEAHGMTVVSDRANLHRVSLYRMLSDEGNPEFQSVLQLLKAWGLKFSVVPEEESRRAA